jgi:hypothetical protein
MFTTKHVLAIMVLLALALAGGTAAASAAPPSSPPLTPPPPSFEACKATGSGTICSGTQTEAYGPDDTGIVCGTGPDAFDVFDQATHLQTARRFYDDNGNWVRRQEYDTYNDGQWSNPLNGKTAQYTQRNIDTTVLATPGDQSTTTDTITGEIIMRSGTGSPVLFATGRQVYGPSGDLEFSAGRNDLTAFFNQDNTHALDTLCAALS